MYYVTTEQEKWLLANGLKPYCPEKGVTLTEAIQWFWSNCKVDCSYECLPKGPVCGKFWYFDVDIWECKCHEIFQTIPEALSWAIDQAINHVNTKPMSNNRPQIVESPITNSYLTKGKQYGLIDYWSKDKDTFCIKSDKGHTLYCILKRCSHIDNKDWIVIK